MDNERITDTEDISDIAEAKDTIPPVNEAAPDKPKRRGRPRKKAMNAPAEPSPDGEACKAAEGEPVAEAQGEPVAETEGEPVAETEGEPVAEIEGEPVAEIEGEPVAEIEGEPVAETEGEPVAEAQGEPVAETEGEPVAEAQGEPVAEIEGEPVVETEAEPVTEVEAEPIAEVEKEEIEIIPSATRPKKTKNPSDKYDPDNPRKIDVVFDFIELFVFTLVAVLFVTTFFVRHSIVEGWSMKSTLSEGDTLIISDLFYTPEAGDIVVVEDYTTNLKKPIVKRVIATEGQKVNVRAEGVYVDGKLLDEPYVFVDYEGYRYTTYAIGALRDNPTYRQFVDGYEFVVPKGELFIMGDHRNDSKDSRDIGTVSVDSVLGKVLFRLFPFDSFGSVE